MQSLVWLFRSAGSSSSYIDYASPQTKQLIHTAYPGGWDIVSNYHQGKKAADQLVSMALDQVSCSIKLPSGFSPRDFLTQDSTNRVVNEQLQTLINTPVGGQVLEAGPPHSECIRERAVEFA